MDYCKVRIEFEIGFSAKNSAYNSWNPWVLPLFNIPNVMRWLLAFTMGKTDKTIISFATLSIIYLKGNSRVGQHFWEKPCKCFSHCNTIKKYIFSDLFGSEIEIQSVKFAAYSNFRHYSLCTDVPPPSGKIGKGDVCESPTIVVFPFRRNVGDSLWLVVMLMPWRK